jgi:uncharacterized protein YggE
MLRVSIVLGTGLAVVALLIGGLAAYFSPGMRPPAVSAQTPAAGGPPSITVTAEGRASGRPDQAMVSVGVETVRPTATEALTEANRQTEAILAKLDEFGIAREDVQTSGINLFPVHSEQPDPAMSGVPQITGYRAINQVTVLLKNLDQVGQVLDGVVTAGANQVQGVQFIIADDSALATQAMQQAVAAARPQADAIAAGMGLKSGEVLRIEQVPSAGPPVPLAQAAGKGGVPIEPGQLTKQVQVQVTFALVPSP